MQTGQSVVGLPTSASGGSHTRGYTYGGNSKVLFGLYEGYIYIYMYIYIYALFRVLRLLVRDYRVL